MNQIQHEAIDHYALLQEHRHLKQVVFAISHAWLSIASVMLPIIRQKRELESIVVDEMQRLLLVIPKKIVLRVFRFSTSMFRERIQRAKIRCGISPLDRCLKRHPLQLSIGEVDKIKTLFDDLSKACWPSSSLFYHGLRFGGLYISLSTFYKYVNLLGLKRKFPRAMAKTLGLKASTPNQYLHVDTTIWPLENGKKAYIAFVSDNFSHAILGQSVSLRNTAANVKVALKEAIHMIQEHHSEHHCAVLVADGGSENHALTINELLQQCPQPQITKIIAQKDIHFSNSPIEAINRIVKKYLRHYNPKTEAALQKVLEFVNEDYNYHRPHISLNGLMPMEAYTQPKMVLEFYEEKKRAKSLRLLQNQKSSCQSCL